jgi:hypothetical protein
VTPVSSVEACQLRATWPSPAVALRPVGALGALVSAGGGGAVEAVTVHEYEFEEAPLLLETTTLKLWLPAASPL